jgi:phosphate transport system substrate-binding protein
MTRIERRAFLGGAASLTLAGSASAGVALTGAGSTFVEPVMTTWIGDYERQNHGAASIAYQGVGSSAGIDMVKAHKVDFGASDKPLTPKELHDAGLAQFPIVVGGVVPVFNVPGIASGQLHLTGRVLADIYLGKVTHWNDGALTSLNPGLRLPNAPIVVVHRQEGSGTSFNFTNYLSKVSPEWRARVGEGTLVNWPTGDAEKGNDGVGGKVAATPNSIGYVEFTFVVRHKLAWAYVRNHAGRDIDPSVFAFQTAAEGGGFRADQDFYLVITDSGGPNAYPIAATTFILVPRRADPAKIKAMEQFFGWALEQGRSQATHLGYVPLPHPVVQDVEAYWTRNLGK